MPVYTAQQIYRFARMAGFSPDQSATMTAIALAESGGNSGAHNPHGEDSRGLWQINSRAHPDLAGVDLYDPVENARAAFRISRSGADVSPWTTTHGGGSAKYLAYRTDAEVAARAAGDGAGLGVWTGTPGYGSPLAAGGGGGSPFPGPGFPVPSGAPSGGPSAGVQEFVRSALAQAGDRYVFGSEANPNDPDPKVFDCSELTQWAAHRAGVDLPDGSWLQYRTLAQQGGAMSVEQALKTPGALLFHFSSSPTDGGRPGEAHVAISLGDGRTIEARNSRAGVGVFSAQGMRFNYAAAIPQFGTGTGAVPTTPDPSGGLPPIPPDYGPAIDSDGDGIIDGRELALGTNPQSADSDADGISDGYELLKLHTNPLAADTDGDGIDDSVELATGSDPTSVDSDHDGVLDGSTSTADTDHDGLSDELERFLRLNPASLDTDGDGFSDGLEYDDGSDPTSPLSNPLGNPLGNPLDSTTAGAGAGGLGAGTPGAHYPQSGLANSGLASSGLAGSGLSGYGVHPADPTAGLDDIGAT